MSNCHPLKPRVSAVPRLSQSRIPAAWQWVKVRRKKMHTPERAEWPARPVKRPRGGAVARFDWRVAIAFGRLRVDSPALRENTASLARMLCSAPLLAPRLDIRRQLPIILAAAQRFPVASDHFSDPYAKPAGGRPK
jgi:hypothetical protein